MNWLAENALVIWALGAIALAVALVIYFDTRSPKSQIAVALVVLVTAALLLVEWFVETPREAVNRTLHELAAAVEANDVPEILLYISPTAVQMRSDVEKLMPKAQVEMARIVGTPVIEFDDDRAPKKAAVQLRGVVRGKIKNTGLQGTVPDTLTVNLQRSGERWLIEDYTSERNWQHELVR